MIVFHYTLDGAKKGNTAQMKRVLCTAVIGKITKDTVWGFLLGKRTYFNGS